MNYNFPTLCAWCGSPSVVDKRKCSWYFPGTHMEYTGSGTEVVKLIYSLDLPLCTICKKYISQLGSAHKTGNKSVLVATLIQMILLIATIGLFHLGPRDPRIVFVMIMYVVLGVVTEHYIRRFFLNQHRKSLPPNCIDKLVPGRAICCRLDDSPWGDIYELEFFNSKFNSEFNTLNPHNSIRKVLVGKFGYAQADLMESRLRMSSPWNLKTGMFVGTTDDTPLQQTSSEPNPAEVEPLTMEERERKRIEKYGIEVVECPRCSTINSLSFEKCVNCSASLAKEKSMRNPYL